MENFRWMEITSRQFKHYILSGGDIAALPVGSMEAMGPHLPVGVKYFIAKAIAEEVCKTHGGLCLPAMPLSPITGSKKRGGIGLDFQTASDYITDAVCEAHENGIRRMLIVGFYDEIYYNVTEIFQEYDIPLIHIDPNNLRVGGACRQSRFNALAAGCLVLLNETALLSKTLELNEKFLREGGLRAPDDEYPVANLLKVEGSDYPSGIFPHFYNENEYKTLPTANIDAGAAADAIKKWAAELKIPLEAYAKYSQVFPRARYDRGLRMGGVGYER